MNPDSPESNTETAPSPPALDTEPGLSSALVLCEKTYQAKQGTWVVAGIFNQLTVNTTIVDDPEISFCLFPSNAIYFRFQGKRQKKIQVLFCLRIIELNGKEMGGASTVARIDAELESSNHFSSDGGFPIPQIEIPFVPKTVLDTSKKNTVLIQVEAWVSGKLSAYHVVRIEMTIEKATKNLERKQ